METKAEPAQVSPEGYNVVVGRDVCPFRLIGQKLGNEDPCAIIRYVLDIHELCLPL